MSVPTTHSFSTGTSRLADPSPPSSSILVLAPVGQDAQALARVLADVGYEAAPCRDVDELCCRLTLNTPLLLIAEEGLATGTDRLVQWLDGQPPWSDLPIILLTAAGARRGVSARWELFERMGHVILLDRPLHVGALQGAVRTALRSRARQVQARGYLEELEAARVTLEDRVADRTLALEREMAERQRIETALLRAQRLEALGQLTGGVAHDFNNLLQVVMGSLSMLERHGANPERRGRILDAMRQAGERGAKLTQQLLAFARRQPLAVEPIDIAAQIEDMTELLRGALRADTELRLRLSADLWPVETDVTQFEVALLNLVVNARDAMPSGGTVTITAENDRLEPRPSREDIGGEFIRITVTDTGTGMDEATVQRAFEPFYTTKSVGVGTGLGLSQVYGFVRQSGGDVRIDSALGSGTTVSIYLPRSLNEPSPRASRDSSIERHSGGLVLVVEDEAHVASLTCAMLEELGYGCEHVESADAALRLDLSRFAGVVSDVIMPGELDGIGLAKELRRRMPEMPVLLTTGFAGAPEGVASAGFPILKKPYTLEDLSAMMVNHFHRQG